METAPYLLSIRKNNTPIYGVIHVGAYTCNEWMDYRQLGVGNVLWFEGNPESARRGRQLLIDMGVSNWQRMQEAFLSDKDGTETFYNTTIDPRNDSLLEPTEHAVRSANTVTVNRLDSFLLANDIRIENYNALVIDVQGAELKVLIGAGDVLNKLDFIVCEVWRNSETAHYQDANTITQLSSYLRGCKFEETQRTPRDVDDPYHQQPWLDILFERMKL